jgi:hypothetical protein
MRQKSSDVGSGDVVNLARKIITLPPGELPSLIRRMVLERKLSRAVVALDAMIDKQPELKDYGIKALERMGLWWQTERML